MKLSYLESKIFGKVCYGFKRDENGIVEIVPDKAEIVQQIFFLYLAGNSLESIQGYLAEKDIPSPSGKRKWSRDVLNKLLNNFKYTFGIIEYDIFSTVEKLKEKNCRNPNSIIKDEDIWDEQQKQNWNGLIL
ncbi:MAG: hypothetical protein HFE78_04940 [Clostridiales bacterium]|nr:hypothetical protein [Clostridiales bacterium]